ncbi:D-beta-hydroxybutyrate dehydrogenase, mitochondrial-like [Amphiura filiformis]|uniref:D-beta-hydroxybutyrate dehydrogenase, mitochondrial-like n=1 Tax=Amphiura filiformis TaxID=82378 RepID=UPI003B214FDC
MTRACTKLPGKFNNAVKVVSDLLKRDSSWKSKTDLSADQINCTECTKSYIGQPGRQLGQRLKEHKSTASSRTPSAVSEHSTDTNHQIDWDNVLNRLNREDRVYLPPDDEDALRLVAKSSKRLVAIPCDVTSDGAVRSAKDFVIKHLSESKQELYAVVNNAGIWRWSEIEWASMEMYQTLYDVNVKGIIRVTKAFLPIIRRNKGRIVNVGSVGGLYTTPCNAPYCMTKYAIECFSDSLRCEMYKWGVKVALIEPGHYGICTAIKTYLNGYPDRLWQTMDTTAREDYGRDYVERWQKFNEDGVAACYLDPSPVVDAMVDAVTSTHPKHRYIVGGLLLTYWTAYWNMMFPSWLTDRQYIKFGESVATPAALMKSKST